MAKDKVAQLWAKFGAQGTNFMEPVVHDEALAYAAIAAHGGVCAHAFYSG